MQALARSRASEGNEGNPSKHVGATRLVEFSLVTGLQGSNSSGGELWDPE